MESGVAQAPVKINRTLVTKMYKAWLKGASKEAVELEFLGVKNAKGKTFTRLVEKHLGLNTTDMRYLILQLDKLSRKMRADNYNRYQQV